MERFDASSFFWIGHSLERSAYRASRGPDNKALVSDSDFAGYREQIEDLRKNLDRAGLTYSIKLVDRILAHHPEATLRYFDLAQWFKELQRRIEDELDGILALRIPQDRSRYYDQREPFDAQVAASFPSATYDAIEAANCMALARPTACVFHLMRVLEVGLTVVGAKFGVSLAHTNWGPAISELEKKIRGMRSDPQWRDLPECKELQEFYAQAVGHLGIAKDAWRNYTMHARGKSTEEEGERIYYAVRSFIQQLAGRLAEAPTP